MSDSTAPAPLHFYLVRGLIREARHWGTLPDRLLREFPDARITCLDLPGAGLHFQRRSPLQVEQMVDGMRGEFLQNRIPGETAVLVAISLGGMIAAHWLLNHGGDFQRAVLINTSFGRLSPLPHRLRPGALVGMARAALSSSDEREATILRLVSNHPDARHQALPLWNAIRTERPVSFENTLRQLLAAARFRLGDGRPSAPTLLLASTTDRLVNVACSRAIARHWQVPLLEHPTAGHDLPLDDPDWIVKKIHVFVDDSNGKVIVR